MRIFQGPLVATGAALLLVGAAACNTPAPQGDELSQDLAQVTAQNDLALSPIAAGRAEVVSAAERTDAPPAPALAQKVTFFRRAPKANTSAPVPSVEESSVQTVTESHDAPAATQAPAVIQPRPAPRPMPQGRRNGGWKTTAEVIRDAPFPINP